MTTPGFFRFFLHWRTPPTWHVLRDLELIADSISPPIDEQFR